MKAARPTPAFILFETMVAVAIFVLAMMALGRCLNNCIRAEASMREDDRARLALENRMAEIESGAVAVADPKVEELKDNFAGMKLKQSRKPIEWRNEKDEEIAGLYEVELLLTWESSGEKRDRGLNFYVYPRQR